MYLCKHSENCIWLQGTLKVLSLCTMRLPSSRFESVDLWWPGGHVNAPYTRGVLQFFGTEIAMNKWWRPWVSSSCLILLGSHHDWYKLSHGAWYTKVTCQDIVGSWFVGWRTCSWSPQIDTKLFLFELIRVKKCAANWLINVWLVGIWSKPLSIVIPYWVCDNDSYPSNQQINRDVWSFFWFPHACGPISLCSSRELADCSGWTDWWPRRHWDSPLCDHSQGDDC